MTGTVTVCPDCGAATVVHHTTPSAQQSSDPSPTHSCTTCGARFTDPPERERERDTGSCANGLAAELANADPDAV